MIPAGAQCRRKASTACLEPIDLVHPMSKIAYKGFAIKLIPSAVLGKDQRQSGTSVVGNPTDLLSMTFRRSMVRCCCTRLVEAAGVRPNHSRTKNHSSNRLHTSPTGCNPSLGLGVLVCMDRFLGLVLVVVEVQIPGCLLIHRCLLHLRVVLFPQGHLFPFLFLCPLGLFLFLFLFLLDRSNGRHLLVC